MSKRNGPTITVKASCFDCVHERSTSYRVQGDSGHDIHCTLVDRAIGSTWSTPMWCPLLPAGLKLGRQYAPECPPAAGKGEG